MINSPSHGVDPIIQSCGLSTPQAPVAAIIQARMGSIRLPGKVLKTVLGRPLLSHLIERVRTCRSVDRIILATTDRSEDDRICELGEEEQVNVFRGSEVDVLDRYFQAACHWDARHIMRITGDCPLIDPDICDQVAQTYFAEQADYATTGDTFAWGLDCEVISREALEASWRASSRPEEREHVTLYTRNHPGHSRCVTLESPRDERHYRFTVDCPEDFALVSRVLVALNEMGQRSYSHCHITAFLDAHPEILALNRHLARCRNECAGAPPEGFVP